MMATSTILKLRIIYSPVSESNLLSHPFFHVLFLNTLINTVMQLLSIALFVTQQAHRGVEVETKRHCNVQYTKTLQEKQDKNKYKYQQNTKKFCS